jgi:hypothetical protein
VITVEIDALMCIEIAFGGAIAAFVVFIGRAVIGFLVDAPHSDRTVSDVDAADPLQDHIDAPLSWPPPPPASPPPGREEPPR